jgi:putative ATP-dependent endonuclease of the OLD family
MKLVRIDIENFRLLQDASVALSTDQDTTVFVGPNNSGKTSMAEALGLLLSAEKPAISDFSITSYGKFAAFEKIATAAEPEAGAEAAPAELPELPRIALKLHFDYSETPEDLRIAEAFLMDLVEGSSRIVAELEYAVRDPELLRRDFRARHAATNEALVDFLSEHLHDHYGYRLCKVSADGAERELLDERGLLAKLIKIDFLPAQRHMEDKENGSQATRLSRLLNSHYERRHKVSDPASYEELERVVKEQSVGLTGKYSAAFNDLTTSLTKFGYPRTPNLKIRAELTASAIFKDNTRVYYAAEIEAAAGAPAASYDLPERYNGLGFKNLIYMVLQLKAFRDDVRSAEGDRPRVHLIVVEEPEAHLHPQMQTMFIEKAAAFLNQEGEEGAQLILTTHSAHIVAGCGFSPVRYFRRRGAKAVVKDLLTFQANQKGEEASNAISR